MVRTAQYVSARGIAPLVEWCVLSAVSLLAACLSLGVFVIVRGGATPSILGEL